MRLGGKDIEDASANGVFAYHLNRLAALVAHAVEVRGKIVHGDIVIHAQRQGELPAGQPVAGSQQGRHDRCHRDGVTAGSHPVQGNRARGFQVVMR